MSFYTSKLNILAMLMMLALLGACTSQTHYAPLITNSKEFAEDNQNPLVSKKGLNKGNQVVARNMRKHQVEKTWRTYHSPGSSPGYGYQHLAFWNQKLPPHNLIIGKKIKLSNPDPEDRVTDKKQQNAVVKNVNTRQKKTNNSVPDKTALEDKNVHRKQQLKLGVAKKSKSQQQKSIASIDNQKMLELSFGWPIKGRVLKSFSPSHNKGIDIAGKKGQPVKATEAGKVVYGGQGLIGFGKLLIIKHNDDYLSAYANNSRLLVNEGQNVQKGQVIAEVGDVGIKRTSLHFEIRKNGKPVNPVKLLPKK